MITFEDQNCALANKSVVEKSP